MGLMVKTNTSSLLISGGISATDRILEVLYTDTITAQPDSLSSDSLSSTEANIDSDYTDPKWRLDNYLGGQPHTILTLILGLVAISLNLMSFLAVTLVRTPCVPHYQLILSLTCSDILIGLSVTLHIINKVVNPIYRPGVGPNDRLFSSCSYLIIRALKTTALNVTLLNLMGMALDHYLAIIYPLYYPSALKRAHSTIVIILLWIIAAICGFSDFFSAFPDYKIHHKQLNYCDCVSSTIYQDEFTVFAIALVCFATMAFAYLRIYKEIRLTRHRNGSNRPLDRNRKAAITTVIILGSFVVCWLPNCLFQIILIITVKVGSSHLGDMIAVLYHIDQYLFALLLVNSICDPAIYAVRMRKVQAGYRKMFCCGRRRSMETDGRRMDSKLLTAMAPRTSISMARLSRVSMGSIKFENIHGKDSFV